MKHYLFVDCPSCGKYAGKKCIVMTTNASIPRPYIVVTPKDLTTLEFSGDKWILVDKEHETSICCVDEHPEIIKLYNNVVMQRLINTDVEYISSAEQLCVKS